MICSRLVTRFAPLGRKTSIVDFKVSIPSNTLCIWWVCITCVQLTCVLHVWYLLYVPIQMGLLFRVMPLSVITLRFLKSFLKSLRIFIYIWTRTSFLFSFFLFLFHLFIYYYFLFMKIIRWSEINVLWVFGVHVSCKRYLEKF